MAEAAKTDQKSSMTKSDYTKDDDIKTRKAEDNSAVNSNETTSKNTNDNDGHEITNNSSQENIDIKAEKTEKSMVVLREHKGTVIGPNDMDKIENMEIREDDVFAVSFPRSGTTLTQELTYLTATKDFETARKVLLDDRFPFLDLALDGPLYPYFKGVKFIKEKPSPRYIKSHLHHFLLPKELREGKAKIIYIARNPRDVMVSFYKLQKWYKNEERTFEDYFEDFVAGRKILCGPWWSHVKGFWELRDQPNILFLKFEDIVTDKASTVQKISNFLGKPCGSDEISRIVEHCHIENMKSNIATNGKYQDDLKSKDKNYGDFINTGKIGAVEGYYTEDMLRRLQEKFREEFESSGLAFPTFP